MNVIRYTPDKISAVTDYEQRLREEEPFFTWDIGESYQAAVRSSFSDPRFDACISLLAEENGKIIGRIDCTLIPSRFDGSTKAYLDWICVLKSRRCPKPDERAARRASRPERRHAHCAHRRQRRGPALLPKP